MENYKVQFEKALETAEKALKMLDERDQQIELYKQLVATHEDRYQVLYKSYLKVHSIASDTAKRVLGLLL